MAGVIDTEAPIEKCFLLPIEGTLGMRIPNHCRQALHLTYGEMEARLLFEAAMFVILGPAVGVRVDVLAAACAQVSERHKQRLAAKTPIELWAKGPAPAVSRRGSRHFQEWRRIHLAISTVARHEPEPNSITVPCASPSEFLAMCARYGIPMPAGAREPHKTSVPEDVEPLSAEPE